MPTDFHGRRIVLVCAIAQALGVGLISVYGFVTSPIIEEFGATDAQMGLGMSIMLLGMALAGPFLGPLLDRGPIRLVMASGVCVMLASVWALGRGDTLWHLALGILAVSVGFAMYGPMATQVLLVNWYVARRGTALAFAGLGYSISSFIVPVTTAWLVGAFGWRSALESIATVAALVTLPLILWLVVKRPEELGQVPDGSSRPPDASDVRASVEERSIREITRDPNFWAIGIGMGLAHCVPLSSLFLVRHMEGLGVPPERAAISFAVMGVFGMIGKLTSGPLADRLDERLVTLVVLSAMGVGWAAMAGAETFGGMLLASVPIGFGAGGMVPMPALLVGACFGRAMVGRVMGFQAALGLPFLMACPPLVGLVRDHTGDYILAFAGLAGAVAMAVLVLSRVRLPARRAPRSPEVAID